LLCPQLAYHVAAAWRSWRFNCTQFGLTPTVKGRTEIRIVNSPPILPNRFLRQFIFLFLLLFLSFFLNSNMFLFSNRPKYHRKLRSKVLCQNATWFLFLRLTIFLRLHFQHRVHNLIHNIHLVFLLINQKFSIFYPFHYFFENKSASNTFINSNSV